MTADDLDPTNPFAQPSRLPFGLPDYAAIREEHYGPALVTGMAEQRAEIERIATDPAPATVENTLVALERSGRLLSRAAAAFFNQVGSDSTPGLEDDRGGDRPAAGRPPRRGVPRRAAARPPGGARGRRRRRSARARTRHRVAAPHLPDRLQALRHRAARGGPGPPARAQRGDHVAGDRVRSHPARRAERRRRPRRGRRPSSPAWRPTPSPRPGRRRSVAATRRATSSSSSCRPSSRCWRA